MWIWLTLIVFTIVLAASLTLTQVQPFVTLVAGLTAIISGIFAIRFYYNATKKYKDDEVS